MPALPCSGCGGAVSAEGDVEVLCPRCFAGWRQREALAYGARVARRLAARYEAIFTDDSASMVQQMTACRRTNALNAAADTLEAAVLWLRQDPTLADEPVGAGSSDLQQPD